MKKDKKKKFDKYEQESIAEDIFDFHGLGSLMEEEIKDYAYKFLWQAYQRHLYKVRIITGKGLHSKNGPVIKPIVEQYARSLPFVHFVTTAKYNEGGAGALDITFSY
jgi:DNA-nicking Smr family endonuclease